MNIKMFVKPWNTNTSRNIVDHQNPNELSCSVKALNNYFQKILITCESMINYAIQAGFIYKGKQYKTKQGNIGIYDYSDFDPKTGNFSFTIISHWLKNNIITAPNGESSRYIARSIMHIKSPITTKKFFDKLKEQNLYDDKNPNIPKRFIYLIRDPHPHAVVIVIVKDILYILDSFHHYV